MPQSPLQLVEALYRAWNKRDIGAVDLLIDRDIEIHQTSQLPWGGTFRGFDGLRDFLIRLTHSIDSQITMDRLIEAGDQVVAIGRTAGRVRATDRAFDVAAVHVFNLRDGRLVRFEAFVDTPAMLAALGRTGAGPEVRFA